MGYETRGFYKSKENDSIVLQIKEGKSNVLVKDIYLSMMENFMDDSRRIFPKSFWKTGVPLKITLFAWLAFHDRNLTWTNLQKRNWHGPTICSIFFAEAEDNFHIFLNCHKTRILWNRLATHFGFVVIAHSSIMDALQWWSSQKTEWRPIPLLVFWFVWKWRNKRIFENGKEDFGHIYDKIIPFYSTILLDFPHQTRSQHISATIQFSNPWAHFDGASKEGVCGCGVYLHMAKDMQYYIYWNGGMGTSNRAEAMALHGLLIFCTFLEIDSIHIYGDSKVIIEHVIGKLSIKNDSLMGWMNRIAALWKPSRFPISHIKRLNNVEADKLSKKGLQSSRGMWNLSISVYSITYFPQPFKIPGI